MKIALIGAIGFVGSALREEALRRGHAVMALVRHTERLTTATNLAVEKADVMNRDALTGQLRRTWCSARSATTPARISTGIT